VGHSVTFNLNGGVQCEYGGVQCEYGGVQCEYGGVQCEYDFNWWGRLQSSYNGTNSDVKF